MQLFLLINRCTYICLENLSAYLSRYLVSLNKGECKMLEGRCLKLLLKQNKNILKSPSEKVRALHMNDLKHDIRKYTGQMFEKNTTTNMTYKSYCTRLVLKGF